MLRYKPRPSALIPLTSLQFGSKCSFFVRSLQSPRIWFLRFSRGSWHQLQMRCVAWCSVCPLSAKTAPCRYTISVIVRPWLISRRRTCFLRGEVGMSFLLTPHLSWRSWQFINYHLVLATPSFFFFFPSIRLGPAWALRPKRRCGHIHKPWQQVSMCALWFMAVNVTDISFHQGNIPLNNPCVLVSGFWKGSESNLVLLCAAVCMCVFLHSCQDGVHILILNCILWLSSVNKRAVFLVTS